MVDIVVNPDDDEVARLYARASLLLFPSLYEGFGLPPLEAMAAGCPVVCSNAGSLPEIVGEAALVAPPDDGAVLSEQSLRVLREPALRRKLVEAGDRHIQRFNLDAVGGGVLAAYAMAEKEFRGRESRERR